MEKDQGTQHVPFQDHGDIWDNISHGSLIPCVLQGVPQERRLILVLGTLAQHDLVIGVIGMRDSRFDRFDCSFESTVVYVRGYIPSSQCVGY